MRGLLQTGVGALFWGAAMVAPFGPAPRAAQETSQLRLQDGMAALLRGKYDQAVAFYDEAARDAALAPAKLASLHNDRGVAKWRLDMFDDALVDLARAIELAPDQATAYNNRGNVLLDLDRPGEALVDFDKAITLAPGYGAAYNNRGNANIDLARFEAALADYKRAMDLMPANAVPYNGRGKAHGALGRPFAALRYLNRAVTLNGKYTAAYRNRALLLTNLERADEAIADLDRIIALIPNDSELYAARGAANLLAKKLPAALKDYTRAVELDAENATAVAGRGAVQVQREDYPKALADLDQAVALDGELIEARLARADARIKIGNLDGAAEDVAKARALDGQNAEALRLAGAIAEGRGETDGALASYRESVTLDPFFELSKAAIGRLTGEDEIKPAATDDALADWRIVRARGRFIAANPRFETLRVPLEMHGAGEPKVLDWTPLSQSLTGFGLLRYTAGATGRDTPGYEYVAILDLKRQLVLSIEPYIWGTTKARWDWTETGVTVTDPEGLISAYELRAQPKPVVAARRPRRRDQDDPYGWGAWDDRSSRSYQRRRPRNPFDWLFR